MPLFRSAARAKIEQPQEEQDVYFAFIVTFARSSDHEQQREAQGDGYWLQPTGQWLSLLRIYSTDLKNEAVSKANASPLPGHVK